MDWRHGESKRPREFSERIEVQEAQLGGLRAIDLTCELLPPFKHKIVLKSK